MLASLLISFALAAIPPLTPDQRVMLDDTAQASPTVHEAGFYALLENARAWPDDATTAAAADEEVVLASIEKIMNQPEAWSGRLVMLEGTLQGVMPRIDWSRAGWEDVQGLVIRVQDQPVIVYLTQPPPLHRQATAKDAGEDELRQYVSEYGASVKLVARFYKLVEDQTRGRRDNTGKLKAGQEPQTRLFPVFVGRQVMAIQTPQPTRGFPGGWFVALLAVLVAGSIFLLYYRVRAMGPGAGSMTLEQYHQRKQRQRVRDDDAVTPPPPEQSPQALPDDPASALDALSRDRDR